MEARTRKQVFETEGKLSTLFKFSAGRITCNEVVQAISMQTLFPFL